MTVGRAPARFKRTARRNRRNGDSIPRPPPAAPEEAAGSSVDGLRLPSQPAAILPKDFFLVDSLELAPRLLGKFLRRDEVVLQITEVEAYRPNDSACHGRFGITSRTAPVVGQALGITTAWSNHPLYTPGGLEVLDGPAPDKILVGPRVGIQYALPEHIMAPWRFAIAALMFVEMPTAKCTPGSCRPQREFEQHVSVCRWQQSVQQWNPSPERF
ncbi:Methylpurine-DNA glycosylase (MPG) [Musa troglodytarum]|uniref:DNA-3-methyladenine glycosylase II n=1 Tax=Musa troglodytarum TaxID=320322 RepID=A0A9E7KID2_9LILI|nr:Methylpurine-DNA glycosylase (MPG) [Musa troglodytarum]